VVRRGLARERAVEREPVAVGQLEALREHTGRRRRRGCTRAPPDRACTASRLRRRAPAPAGRLEEARAVARSLNRRAPSDWAAGVRSACGSGERESSSTRFANLSAAAARRAARQRPGLPCRWSRRSARGRAAVASGKSGSGEPLRQALVQAAAPARYPTYPPQKGGRRRPLRTLGVESASQGLRGSASCAATGARPPHRCDIAVPPALLEEKASAAALVEETETPKGVSRSRKLTEAGALQACSGKGVASGG